MTDLAARVDALTDRDRTFLLGWLAQAAITNTAVRAEMERALTAVETVNGRIVCEGCGR